MPAVLFDGVSKRFIIHHERARSFQDLLIRRFRRSQSSEEFWALRDVSFAVEPGSALGVVGTNGSGKSTLLKLMTRILTPTSGKVAVNGRVSALLELGAGFHPDLSGRDNVFLNASILGVDRRRVAERFDAIAKFAELERFIDIPVKHYSSGMYARLGFAVAINVDPDVLLIDEVLSVGDESFQDRCLDAIHRFHRAGKTLVLVSHDVASICDVCTDAIWLKDGEIRAYGQPRKVVTEYLEAAHAHAAEVEAAEDLGLAPSPRPDGMQTLASVGHRWGSGEAQILAVEIIDAFGRATEMIRSGDRLVVRVRYRANERIESPVFGLAITTDEGLHVTGPNSKFAGHLIDAIEGEGTVAYVVDDCPLVPGLFRLSASIYDESCTHPYDYHDRMYPLTVDAGDHAERYGVVTLEARWSHEALGIGGRATGPVNALSR
jgi:ABC-type polysaccharide/polyol phosphate transport system ATPase subunit